MCKKANGFCSELGRDPTKWSKEAPLPPPNWFTDQALLFRNAAEKASVGKRNEAVQILRTIRGGDIYEWFDIHGQNSGWHRANQFKVVVPKLRPNERKDNPSPAKYEKDVFQRDGYKCRYCGLRVISKPILVAFEEAVGISEFRNVGKNIQQHGIVHAFKPVADHVVPHRLGGRTNLENLVTSCPACNYGKAHYTVEQLGIDDPCLRSPPLDAVWNGLTSLLSELKRNQIVADETLTQDERELPL